MGAGSSKWVTVRFVHSETTRSIGFNRVNVAGLAGGPHFLCGRIEFVHRLLAAEGYDGFERVGGAVGNLFFFFEFVRAEFGENKIHDDLLPFRLAQSAR